MLFNIIATIRKVYDTKIQVSVANENIEKISNILNKLKKENKVHHELNLDIRSCNIYVNHITWDTPSDLIGIKVIILCKPKYYCYTTPLPSNSVDDKEQFIVHKGITINAVTIKNYNE